MKTRLKSQHSSKKSYFMYGKHAVFAAIANPRRKIRKIYCLAKFAEDFSKELKGVEYDIVNHDFFHKTFDKNQSHQGIAAFVDPIYLNKIEEFDLNPEKERIAILDQITDPQNIGAIIRSAAAFGINKIILPNDNTPEENGAVAKAACGCLELVQIAKIPNIKNAIEKLKKQGFWISGLDAKGKDSINSISSIKKLVIIIGSEDKGIRRLTSESCDFLVHIPIDQNVESLNASNAASIIFYMTNKIS